MRISVVVSAYNNWHALDRTLLGFRCQSLAPVELWVAEDSEFDEVAATVAKHRALAPWPIRHVTQANRGYRKPIMMNRAFRDAVGEFVVFTDADCVPRADLLAAYARLARPGVFLAGGSHLSIPEAFHRERLTDEMVVSQRLFDAGWLREQGIELSRWRLTRSRPLARTLDLLTARNSLNGANTGAWRADLLRVGGYDESMGYGGEDRNLGYRLNNAGVRGVRARHSLVWVHLDHPRGYVDAALKRANLDWNREVRRRRLTWPRETAIPRAADA
ncbi:MAG TPA: glycosyltransferase [Burkholderiaceae bacterium]|nr:glycosyltransferase [Burkholderiaceae bacterium]